MKKLILLLAFSLPLGAQSSSGILDASRATDWTKAGIPSYSVNGTLPSDGWTQCGPTISAYSGSPSTIVNAMNHTGAGYTGCGSNTYVQLGTGTFTLNSGMYFVGLNRNELRGMGADVTHLVFTGNQTCQGGNGSCMIGFDSTDNTDPTSPGPSNVVNWTGTYTKGATTISVSSVANITAGVTEAVLDQCETGYSGSPCSGTAVDNNQLYDCGDKYATTPTGCSVNGPDSGLARPHRFHLEASIITACSPACGTASSGTVTLSTPLIHADWASARTPQMWTFTPGQYVGLRDFSADDSAVHSNIGGISFKNMAYVWARGIAVLHPYNIGIYLTQTINADIVSNYVFDAGQHLAYNDPTGIKYNWSNNLIANNITQAVRPGLMCEGPCAGNAVVANYVINNYTGDDFMFGGEWDAHSNGGDYNLGESNVVDQLTMDLIHGGHTMETWYRNFAPGWESCANGQCGSFSAKGTSLAAVSTQSYNRYPNFVGNILGTPGYTNTYAIASGTCSGSYFQNQVVWILNCGNGGTSPSIPGDTTGRNTVLRYFNWDTANGSTQTNASEVPTGISPYPNSIPSPPGGTYPPSFYFASRPAWWNSSVPFPAIGPDVSGGNVGQCTGTLNTSGHMSGTAATNASQCTGTSLNPGWSGHVNAPPAMQQALAHGIPPDGSGSGITNFTSAWYTSGTPTAATPVLSPVAGTYTGTQTVTMTDSTPSSSIFYTLDGSTPTPSSTPYTGSISVSSTTTVLAIATASGYLNSAVGGGTYTIGGAAAAAPVFSPGTGTYVSGTPVTLSTATSGCGPYIFWGSTSPPTNNGTSFSVLATITIYAQVIGCPGHPDSTISSASYTLSGGASVTLTVAPAGTGSGTVTGCAGSYTAGDPYSCSIAAAVGSTLSSVTGCGGSGTTTYTGTISADCTVVPTFVLNTYGLTVNAGTGGTLSGTNCASGTYNYNTSGVCLATPDSTHSFNNWTGGLLTGSTNPQTFVITGTSTITANWSLLPTASTPTFSPVAGTYVGTQSVTISASTGPVICYNTTGSPATDGSTGCTTGTKYTGPVSVSSSETLYAVSGGTSYLDSPVGSAAYVITVPPPPSMVITGQAFFSGQEN